MSLGLEVDGRRNEAFLAEQMRLLHLGLLNSGSSASRRTCRQINRASCIDSESPGSVVPSLHGPAALIEGKEILVLPYTPGVVTLDISDPAKPTLIGKIDMEPPIANTGTQSIHTAIPIDRFIGAPGDRIKLCPGSFFDTPIPAADAYILGDIIHDWADDEAIAILRAVRRAAPDNARVLLLERMIVEDDLAEWPKLLDIFMFVMFGGIQRTRQEFERLFIRRGAGIECRDSDSHARLHTRGAPFFRQLTTEAGKRGGPEGEASSGVVARLCREGRTSGGCRGDRRGTRRELYAHGDAKLAA
jgi:hypothetical protein